MKQRIKSENIAEIMQVIIRVHHKFPDLRFMQIIENVAGVNDLYHMSDEQLLEQLTRFYSSEIKH